MKPNFLGFNRISNEGQIITDSPKAPAYFSSNKKNEKGKEATNCENDSEETEDEMK